MEIVNEENNEAPHKIPPLNNMLTPHRSKQTPKLSAAGAMMNGVVHETNLERTLREMRETTGQHAHILNDQIMVVKDMEINEVLGVAEDDP